MYIFIQGAWYYVYLYLYRQTMNGIFSEDRSRVEDKKSEEDDEYFSSYSHFGIHAEMLKVILRNDL